MRITTFRKAALRALGALLVSGVALPALAHEFTPGYYYATGWVEPTGSSIDMEGSHKLVNGSGKTIVLLSSDYYSLAEYACTKVRVLGWVEHTVEGHALHMDMIDMDVLEPTRVPVSFKVLENGSDSKYDDVREEMHKFAIRDASTWKLFFQLHKPGGETPFVDFNKYQVVGAFMGPRNTTAHSISIVKVERAGSTLYVTTATTTPPPDSKLPTLKNPIHPFAIARTAKTPGPVYFDGKRVKVLTKTDLLGDPDAFVAIGHLNVPADLDRGKLKAGIFTMNIAARYLIWPGTFPTAVAKLTYSELSALNDVFTKIVRPGEDAPDPGERYYVIVWEDRNDDSSTSGERMAVSPGLIWNGEMWRTEGAGFNPSGIGYYAFDLTAQ